jgi:hypothetical protein
MLFDDRREAARRQDQDGADKRANTTSGKGAPKGNTTYIVASFYITNGANANITGALA